MGEKKENDISRFIYHDNNSETLAGKKNPRTLEEFEYDGNNMERPYTNKFEKFAYDSYEDNFNVLTVKEKDRLLQDKEGTLIDNNWKEESTCSKQQKG